MPGQMPEMLSRGVHLQNLDNILVVANLVKVRDELRNLPPAGDPNNATQQALLRDALVKLTTTKFPVFTTPGASSHFADDWLNSDGTSGWWKEADPIAPVLVAGFIKAIDIALGDADERKGQTPLDIETIWVCTPPADQDIGSQNKGRVHLGITWGGKSVVVVIYTPRLPDNGVVPGPVDPVVVVRWEGAPMKTAIVFRRPG